MNVQDKRVGIAPRQTIKLKDTDNGTFVDFIIENEIGRGGSCIVYSATYKQNDITRHCRLKEFYPADSINYYYDISRNGSELKIEVAAQEQFDLKKERFLDSVKKQILFYETISKTRNQVAYVGGIYEGGNTVFYTMLCDQGISYDCIENESLIDILKTAKAVAQAVQNYHNHEVSGRKDPILHLDIKPQNIFILEESEVIKLFDFDSVIHKCKLGDSDIIISSSEGYMPYEVRDASKHYLISEKSDIYSIGAIVFERIIGRTVTINDEDNGYVDIPHDNPLFANTSVSIFEKFDKFFERTCLGRMKQRYSNVEELVAALDELIEYAKPIEYSLKKFLPSVTSSFVGREKELEQIDTILTESNHVFLSAMAGMGKTELALKYANIQEKNKKYKCYFVTYQESILETISSLEFSNFAQYCKKNEVDYTKRESVFEAKLELLATNGDSVLLIVDNMDIEKEELMKTPYFERLISCGIKIIFTTRTLIDEYSVKVNELQHDNLVKFFDCNACNVEAVKKLIAMLEGHSFALSLVSKCIKQSLGTLTPEMVLYELEKGDLDSEKNTSVAVSKRGIPYYESGISASLYNQIRKLFEFAELSNAEKECLKNLALFKNGIDIDAFMEFKGADCINTIKNIDKKGWLKYDQNTSTISIHSIIRFLIPNELGINDASIISHCLNELTDYATTNIEKIKKVITIAIIISDNELIDANIRIKLYDAIAYKSCYWFGAEEFCRNDSRISLGFTESTFQILLGSYIDKRYSIIKKCLVNSYEFKEHDNFDRKEIIKSCLNICLFDWAIMNKASGVSQSILEEYVAGNEYWLKAIRMAENLFDETDEIWSFIYRCFGNMYFVTSGYKNVAKDYYEKALELLKDTYENAFARAELLLRIGDCEMFECDYKKTVAALSHYKESLKIFNNALPPTHFLICYILFKMSKAEECRHSFSFFNKWYKNLKVLPKYISYKINESRFLLCSDSVIKLKNNIQALSIYSDNLPTVGEFEPYSIYEYGGIEKYADCEAKLNTYIKLLKKICKSLYDVENHPQSICKGKQVEEYRKDIYLLIEQLEKHLKQQTIINPISELLFNKRENLCDRYTQQFDKIYGWLEGDFANEDLCETSEKKTDGTILALNDGTNGIIEFELLDSIRYNNDEYVVLLPADVPEEEPGEVVILKVVISKGDESYVSVGDEEVVNAVFSLFKEHTKDDFEFVD